jgi:hypothetical protein
MKNIAVILRGHYRTWDYNHKEAFKFYESIAENVEYYFVTWRFENMFTKRITDSFEDNGKKLIKLLTIYPDDLYYNSWQGPSWLNYAIIPYKKQRELEIVYDAVFDTRPDIIYKRINNKIVSLPEPNTLCVTRYEPQVGPDGKKHVGIEDHFMMSTSDVHNRMCIRHIYRDEIGCQSQILKLATDFGIHTALIDWVRDSIVRPTAFASIPNPENYFNIDYTVVEREWGFLPVEQKLALLKHHAIREEDYTTSSILAKL